MNRTHKGMLSVVVLLALGVSGWFALRETPVAESAPGTTQAAVEAPSEPAAAAPDAAEARSVPAACDGPELKLALATGVETVCAGPLATIQNGSIRQYRVETTSAPARWLRIEAMGSQVFSAAIGSAGARAPEFLCKEADCKGISISRHDVQGIRTISLSEARLTAGEDAVLVTGELRTQPEDQVAAASCPNQGVSIITSDSSASSFCPNAGAGFEVGNDGNRTYRFTNLDGASLLVALDDAERVKQVRYEGDDTLVCKSGSCGQIDVSPTDAEGQRTFTFAGTTLIETNSGERNAVLNGTLVVPPL